MRIGIFGGSFDPVHLEHVAVAESAVRSLALDVLFVMPAKTPPHKNGKILSSDEDRLNMCKIAFRDCKNVVVSDYEIMRGGTSYTYLTCRDFRKKYPTAEIFFIVGTDMLRDFPTWKNPESILNDVTLAVCARDEDKGWLEREREVFAKYFDKDFAVIDYNGKPVSSTKIRVLGAAGYDLTEFVGAKINAYIYDKGKGLYEIDGAKVALALEKPSRIEHSFRVAFLAAKKAVELKIPEKKAIAAALFHDCAKNLTSDSPYLEGFVLPDGVPNAVAHQFSGAYVAEKFFGVKDEDVLNAIRYHTSGRENMSPLEKLVFLADMLEEGRTFDGVERLRELFFEDLDKCLKAALFHSIDYLQKKNADIYPLTQAAYEFYR